jgi:hypothetical protein
MSVEHDYYVWCDCGSELLAIDKLGMGDDEYVIFFNLYKDYESSLWRRIKCAFKVIITGRLLGGEVCLSPKKTRELIDRLKILTWEEHNAKGVRGRTDQGITEKKD